MKLKKKQLNFAEMLLKYGCQNNLKVARQKRNKFKPKSRITRNKVGENTTCTATTCEPTQILAPNFRCQLHCSVFDSVAGARSFRLKMDIN